MNECVIVCGEIPWLPASLTVRLVGCRAALLVSMGVRCVLQSSVCPFVLCGLDDRNSLTGFVSSWDRERERERERLATTNTHTDTSHRPRQFVCKYERGRRAGQAARTFFYLTSVHPFSATPANTTHTHSASLSFSRLHPSSTHPPRPCVSLFLGSCFHD